MPASNIVTSRSPSPSVIFAFRLNERRKSAFRSGSIGDCLRFAPLGLPLCPGFHWYSFGGRPGPTLYSCSTGDGEAEAWSRVLGRPPESQGLVLDLRAI